MIMVTKIKVSEDAKEKLDFLSTRLDLKRNIICRMAIGRSLAIKETVKNEEYADSAGYEYNRYTLTGDQDVLYKALITQHEGKQLDDNTYFKTYLRNHIERGTKVLYDEYNKINSPINFLIGLIDKQKRIYEYDQA